MNEVQNIRGTAQIAIEIESSEMAEILCRALRPETLDVPSDRAITQVHTKENILILEIQADDLTALRAAANSFLSWISGSKRAVDSIQPSKSL